MVFPLSAVTLLMFLGSFPNETSKVGRLPLPFSLLLSFSEGAAPSSGLGLYGFLAAFSGQDHNFIAVGEEHV